MVLVRGGGVEIRGIGGRREVAVGLGGDSVSHFEEWVVVVKVIGTRGRERDLGGGMWGATGSGGAAGRG
jgi:hypothetical protein